eukprot:180845-Amphidinium_carterae.1
MFGLQHTCQKYIQTQNLAGFRFTELVCHLHEVLSLPNFSKAQGAKLDQNLPSRVFGELCQQVQIDPKMCHPDLCNVRSPNLARPIYDLAVDQGHLK